MQRISGDSSAVTIQPRMLVPLRGCDERNRQLRVGSYT